MRRATTLENSIERQMPADVLEKLNLKPFETVEIGHPDIQRVAPKVHVTTGENKVLKQL